jgi:tRNA (guanosine-2'-O-)-methyltransferase
MNTAENTYVLQRFREILTAHKVALFNRISEERTRHISIVLEDIFQEHNASAVIRSCDCFGIQDLYTIEDKNKYVLQRNIALGSGRWIDLHRFTNKETASVDCLKDLREKGYKLVATSPHANAYTPETLPIEEPIALIFGTERRGLTESILANADYHLTIPMYGFTESFNLSVSVVIILQTLRNRLEKATFPWKLSMEEQDALQIIWSTRILNGGEALEKQFRTAHLEKEF